MTERVWGQIIDGATFEALVTTLVCFEDPSAILLGRRGKDGGQDVRSGDRTLVFQAKHHEDGSALKAIADAKKEASKIKVYRAPGNSRYGQWVGVTHWRLVTNAVFNPTDQQKWDTEIVPLFAEAGLVADYWERANLDALLDKHPEVDRSFFGNETRAFLTLPELRERLVHDEPFLQAGGRIPFVGREPEIARVQAFLSSEQLFLVVHGAGGIGKTRLLIEAGEQIAEDGEWQVFWANIASMETASTWFDAIVCERPTLLLVDEPDDERLLRILAEQLGGKTGRNAKWKVVVAVRSPKDPVLRFLFGPKHRTRVEELSIMRLSNAAAERMCEELLSIGSLGSASLDWRRDTARELAKRFSQHPIWLTLAIHVLQKHGDLSKVPQRADTLADLYIEEIIKQGRDFPSEKILSLLRWVSILGTVNRDDTQTVKLIGEGTEIKDDVTIKQQLANLVSRQALRERGAGRRLVELKPDVLRDHILLRWLSVDVGYGDHPVQPSPDAQHLIQVVLEAVLRGNISALMLSILVALAHTERLLRLSGQPLPLLDPFFNGLQSALSTTSASVRLVITEVLLRVAQFRPSNVIRIVRELRTGSVKTERVKSIFRSRDIGHDDIILELAWPVYHAAMGAQTPAERQFALEELCAIAELEVDISKRLTRGLPNDGKRSAQLIGQTIEGGPQFWGDFDAEVQSVALAWLERVTIKPASTAEAAVLKALIVPATMLDRSREHFEGHTLHIQRYTVLPSNPAWRTRTTILTRIKDVLANDELPSPTRLVLWQLFAEAHRSANQCSGNGSEEFKQRIHQELLDDMGWAHQVLQKRGGQLAELTAARALWEWHLRFDVRSDLKAASQVLEALYANNDLAREFAPLLSYDDLEDREPRANAKAIALAADTTASAINDFLNRATAFLGSEKEIHQVGLVALHLGSVAAKSPGVQNFVRSLLTEATASSRSDFAAIIVASWATNIRKTETLAAARDLIFELLGICGSDDQRIQLVWHLYGGVPPRSSLNEMTSEEHAYLRSLAKVFLEKDRGPAFLQTIGCTFRHDWLGYKATIERVLESSATEKIGIAINALSDSIFWALRDSVAATIPHGLEIWLLDQLLRVPDIDSIDSSFSWRLGEILKKTGRAPLSWLPNALNRRKDMEVQIGRDKAHAVSSQTRLSQYVTRISSTDSGDAVIIQAVKALLDLAGDTGSVGYYLPELLHDIDPDGFIVPPEIALRITQMSTKDDIWRLARIAHIYGIGSAPWRLIAKPATQLAAKYSEEAKRSIYSTLSQRGVRSWSGTPGVVPELFISDVSFARQMLASELDLEFRPFWEWNLATAEAELKAQEEYAKEERGE